MSIHLVGGGWSDSAAPVVLSGFLREAAARAVSRGRTPARVGLVLMGTDADSLEYHQRYLRALDLAGAGEVAEIVVTRLEEGETCGDLGLDDLDALFVGGGPTPEYHASLAPAFDAIRDAVEGGLPYLGISAGAQIAARRAVIGGWRVSGVAVAPEDSGEELDEVVVVDGIGLVEEAVEVHTAQWGTLGRAVAVVAAGLVDQVLALDESTVLIVGEGAGEAAGEARGMLVAGEGAVHRVRPAEHGVGDEGVLVVRLG